MSWESDNFVMKQYQVVYQDAKGQLVTEGVSAFDEMMARDIIVQRHPGAVPQRVVKASN